jgi:hypothetical protein
MIDTKELRKLAEKATPGPWTPVSDLPDWGVSGSGNGNADPVVTLNRKYRAPWRQNLGCSQIDAEYIAACSPDNIIQLLNKLDRYEEALRFYADEESMKSLTGLSYGRRARAALEGGEK